MRKRAYKKAKRKNTQANWAKFRRLRNETTSMIRNSKKKKKKKKKKKNVHRLPL